MNKCLVIIILILAATHVFANQAATGSCATGGQKIIVQGLNSTNPAQASYPSCTVTVYLHGTTTIASIFSDNQSPPTMLSNPFTASSSGAWVFYAANGRYDATMTGGTPSLPSPVTISDIQLTDTTSGIGDNPTVFGGSLTAKRIGNVRQVNCSGSNPQGWGGSDCGGWVNSAIADFGAAPACGEISLASGSATFSTNIVATGRNGCWIHGQGRGAMYATSQSNTGTDLMFTGTGDAIKFDGSGVGTYRSKVTDLTLDLTGSTNGIGVELIAAYYSTLRDLSIVNPKYGVKVNGGGPFGLNVIRIDHTDVLNASTAAYWLTGPSITGQQAYNVVIIGGQANCLTTTNTDGVLIDQFSQNNQVYDTLINGCSRAIHDKGATNVFRDVSAQGNTTAFQIDSTSAADLIDNPYLFSNSTNFADSGKDTMYMNIAPAYGPNKMAQPLWIFPYAGGGFEPGMVFDTDGVGGPPRITLYGSTGSSTYPPYSMSVDASGTFYLQRADITSTVGTLANKAKTMQLSATGALTIADNTSTTKFATDGSGNVSLAGVVKNVAATATMGMTLKKGTGSADYTSTSTSYVQVDGINLAFTVTIPTGWKLKVDCAGSFFTNTAAVAVFLALTDGGSVLQEIQGNPPAATSTFANPFALTYVVNGDGASHTIDLRYHTSNASDAVGVINTTSTRWPTMTFTLMPSN